jgi:ABC-type Fe3+-hydroxamate transport system substrate-binding protein
MNKKMILGLFLVAVSLTSCNQISDKAKEEANKAISQTNQNVQKVIDDLGLVYVEEGAQNIITYDEVNAAQQAWCDALVQIGKLKEEGGDYKGYAEQLGVRWA